MPSPAAGDRAPDFRLATTQGEVVLSDLLAGGAPVVLVFYFEDGTPSCETELRIFRDAAETLNETNARVIAISADSLASHDAFGARLGGVPFPLASDVALDAARAYGVVDEGDDRRSRRAVFVVAPDGSVALAIPHFQPNNIGQVEEIFGALAGTGQTSAPEPP
jgi:peroxiredoxin